MGSSKVECAINNVIQQHCKPGKKNFCPLFPLVAMFLGIYNEKSHHVHADLRWPCSCPDFPGRNQCQTLQPMFLVARGLWDSLRCEHYNTEGNLQAFKTQKT